ncbi:nodulation protein NolB [Bradyrhizobium erythrophlei]|uniref:nodulation protein NolB n=1 Tax=Bradyrhizobium erythrophlei TaxID=1437360 RepID=UPI0035E9CB17
MTPFMMFGAAPISPSPVECLTKACSPTVLGELTQFQQGLVEAASDQRAASSSADRAAFVPSVSELQRVVTQASPPGERVLQSLSAMYRSDTVPSAAVGSVSASLRDVQPGPAARPLLPAEDVGPRTAGKAEGVENFESMLANLRDVYKDVIQVSLVSKSTSAVSSSLNKLLSAG